MLMPDPTSSVTITPGEPDFIHKLALRLTDRPTLDLIFDDEDADDHTVILCRSGSKPAAILPIAPAYQPALGQVAIFEWTDYLLRGPALQAVSLAGQTLERLDDGLYSLHLKNRVGQLRLTMIANNRRYQVPLAVLSGKYPTPQDHLDFFNPLLEDLIRRSVALPFHIVQPTAFAADESPEPPTLLFVYHFLRHYGAEIQAALETILGNPHRTLLYDDDLVPLAQATYADAAVLDAIITQPQLLTRTRQRFPVTQALRGHAPTHLWQPLAEETFDTPPNRFAKQFLSELADWSAHLGEAEWLNAYLEPLDRVRDKLAFAQYDRMWDNVGPMHRFPAENQVLLKRHGYRDWADLWRRFHQARVPVFRHAQEAIDTRDIATLYEVWCFFALVGQIRKLLELDEQDLTWYLNVSDEKGLEYTTWVKFGQTGYRLRYNEGFGRAEGRSYSVSLRPDYTLHGPNKLRIVFDAKFRFDASDFEIEDTTEERDVQLTAKKADLYKMHTYRDALHARAAIVLYPGSTEIFYHTDASVSYIINWDELVKKGKGWMGIGAAPMRPNQET